jgi:hypothetical protein
MTVVMAIQLLKLVTHTPDGRRICLESRAYRGKRVFLPFEWLGQVNEGGNGRENRWY